MFNIGMPELILIFLIILLIFGGKKIPEIARGIGKGIREFRKAKDSMEDELNEDGNKKTPAAASKPAAPAEGEGKTPEPPASKS